MIAPVGTCGLKVVAHGSVDLQNDSVQISIPPAIFAIVLPPGMDVAPCLALRGKYISGLGDYSYYAKATLSTGGTLLTINPVSANRGTAQYWAFG